MFIQGKIYKRSDLHSQYGGNRQSGISCPANTPIIFIFSGSTGQKHGYEDQWENDEIFSYTGEGQLDNMEFIRGNLQLKDHISNNKRVFLFEYTQKGFVKFSAEVEVFDLDFFESPDRNGKLRNAIKFFFKRVGGKLPYSPEVVESVIISDELYIARRNQPTVTERTGLVTSRVGQGAYRKSLLYRWKFQCAVTGYRKSEILIASHIVPWKTATDFERLDVNNGIILSPTYDALFDQKLISFDNNGKIVLANQLRNTDYNKIGVTGNERIRELNVKNLQYLERHRFELD